MPSYFPIQFQSNEPLVADQVLALAASAPFRMTASGSLVGITASVSPGFVGKVSFVITINGAPGALALTLHSGSLDGHAASAPGLDEYRAGDIIGVQFSTSPDFIGDGASAFAMLSIYEPLMP